ncbi:MAG: alpha/beta hydrolase [Bryobacteraceae bacterium]|jgi:predicted esterase
MTVDFIHKFVPGSLPVTVLLLHGSGGDENDLLPVARVLVPGAAFLSPRGKVVDQGLRRFFALDRSDVKERAAELAEWIGEAAKQYRIDTARMYALGYSNGANIAAVLMLLHPGSIAGACLLRSRAMVDPETLPSLEGTPVLISAGQSDHLIKSEDAEALAKLLTNAGARVDLAIQNAGHDLTPADFSLAKQWFSKVVR